MGDFNSRRARRRHRGKYRQFYANHVWWMGRWMVRTYTTKKIDLGGGRYMIASNESWHEPGVIPTPGQALLTGHKELD